MSSNNVPVSRQRNDRITKPVYYVLRNTSRTYYVLRNTSRWRRLRGVTKHVVWLLCPAAASGQCRANYSPCMFWTTTPTGGMRDSGPAAVEPRCANVDDPPAPV